jgi:hypothetical protein
MKTISSSSTIQEIINKYQSGIGYTKLSGLYHTSNMNIKIILTNNNITLRGPTPQKITDEDKVIKLYKSGIGTSHIAEIFNCNPLIVRKILKRNQIRFRSLNQYRTYQMDPIDLITPQSELTSYWFGFFLADAFIAKYRNQIRCNLAFRDIGHLFLLAKDIRSNYQPKKCWKKKSNGIGKYPGSYLSINNGDLQQFYFDNGWNDFRSGKMNDFEKHLDTLDIRHFIRGLWDGDGCVSYHPSQQGRYRYLRMGFIDSHKSCVRWIVDQLCHRIQISPNKILPGTGGNAHVVSWVGSPAVEIARYLYCNSTRYLQRKLDKVRPFIYGDKHGQQSDSKSQRSGQALISGETPGS